MVFHMLRGGSIGATLIAVLAYALHLDADASVSSLVAIALGVLCLAFKEATP